VKAENNGHRAKFQSAGKPSHLFDTPPASSSWQWQHVDIEQRRVLAQQLRLRADEQCEESREQLREAQYREQHEREQSGDVWQHQLKHHEQQLDDERHLARRATLG
jgi:hypothetical protein